MPRFQKVEVGGGGGGGWGRVVRDSKFVGHPTPQKSTLQDIPRDAGLGQGVVVGSCQDLGGFKDNGHPSVVDSSSNLDGLAGDCRGACDAGCVCAGAKGVDGHGDLVRKASIDTEAWRRGPCSGGGRAKADAGDVAKCAVKGQGQVGRGQGCHRLSIEDAVRRTDFEVVWKERRDDLGQCRCGTRGTEENGRGGAPKGRGERGNAAGRRANAINLALKIIPAGWS